MDDEMLEKYHKIIENEEYKETFGVENTDRYLTDMYYLEDGTYIYGILRYGTFTIFKIFKDGKVLYDLDDQ